MRQNWTDDNLQKNRKRTYFYNWELTGNFTENSLIHLV